MKRYSAWQIVNGYVNHRDQEDWLKYWEMCTDYVAQSARGQRALRIRKTYPNEVRADRALDRLMVAKFDDGHMLCYYNFINESNYRVELKNLRDVFDH